MESSGNYLTRIRSFSRNAKLYVTHVFGMDFIYGTWEVLFNLYLLAIGFGFTFIGLRLLIGGISGALSAIPAASISDRIGRKASFITGDGGGAAFSLIEITSISPVVLLVTPIFRGFFGTLHGVSEPPFMAENSSAPERVHFFSVALGVRTIASVLGAASIAALPIVNVALGEKIFYYRLIVGVGIIGWFLSLMPALLLKEVVRQTRSGHGFRLDPLKTLQSRWTVSRLLLVEGLLSLGAGLTLPFLNAYFKQGLSLNETYIGSTYAVGFLLLAIGSFLAPLASARLGKVRAIFISRTLSVPFILILAYASLIPSFATAALAASVAYVARASLFNMSNPVSDAFNMEMLIPSERAAYVGLSSMTRQGLAGLASLVGGFMMNGGNFVMPFLLMASLYLSSNVLYLKFFKRARTPGLEAELQTTVGSH